MDYKNIPLKLAITHDWLKNISGSERVLIELHKIYPEAPIYTLFYDKKFVRKWLPKAEIRTSFLQNIPLISKFYLMFAWLMPTAIESLDLSEFDTAISSSAIFSKGLVLKPSTKHFCYCYSPTRMLWDWQFEYSKNKSNSFYNLFYRHLLRIWDRSAADRVDQFVAISKVVQSRIKKYYRKDSIVIYPPVNDLSKISPETKPTVSGNQDFYLIVSRLHKYKNIDIAIEAFNKLAHPLVIIGDGPDRRRLEAMAGSKVTFLGEQDDSTLAGYYSACKAFVMPQEEDFGITPVEAMFFGKPVLALRRGGALETVLEGVTGEFFDDPIPEALANAVRRLNDNYSKYDPVVIAKQASLFSSERFALQIQELLK